MEVFLTADLHFDHYSKGGGILKWTPRPWSCIEEMNEALIANWNATVPRSGLTWVLGDFAWRRHAHFLQRLNGKTILVKGNHDRMPEEALRLFKDVRDGETMMSFGNHQQMWGTHYCPRVWNRGHYGIPCAFGHSHGRIRTFNLSFDTGIDSKDITDEYRPNHLDEALAWVAGRREEMMSAGRIVGKGIGGQLLYRQDDVAWALKQRDERIEDGEEEE